MVLIAYGLFEKVVLADGIVAPVADKVFNSTAQTGFISSWVGTLAFAAQIFLDFDGYSLCAIGAAMCLGFGFPDNFRFPYAAVGFSDFWRRWHISLSSWLRDYLYVSLGGNRKGSGRTSLNLMLTMLLGGLWHGAAWHFVIWGGLHGAFLIAERQLKILFMGVEALKHRFVQMLLALMTFLAVCLTWVFFRAADWSSALTLLRAMFGGGNGGLTLAWGESAWALIVIVTLLVMHWNLKDASLEERAVRIPVWARPLVLAGLLLCIVLMPGDNRAFIYFQF
jgi:D-alanyl-lipoteichoic acid acyltransferase DltB (MBOAT superfamily)